MSDRQGPATEVADPYALDQASTRRPPRHLRERVRFLGPSLILSAGVVGSGELITTTTIGATAGFALLWLIIVSTTVKVWVQMELATWSILRGTPALSGYASVPPRVGRAGWINVLWFLMEVAKAIQRGGIIGGIALSLSLVLPLVGGPSSTASTTVWTVVVVAAVIGLMVGKSYRATQRIAGVMVGLVLVLTVVTVFIAVGLPFTPYAYTLDDLATGFSFTVPAAAVGLAVGVFGLTGVGADEITIYTYWCAEKGYARWTGPDDGTEERARRAEGWIKVMRLDVLVGWLICTLCTLSFYTVGAAVLHPQDLVPEGNDVISTLRRVYTDTLGDWAGIVFIFCAVAVLGATLIATVAAVPRLWAHNVSLFGGFDWHDGATRKRVITRFTVGLPIVWGAAYLIGQSPVVMVVIGGIGGTVFLLGILVAIWYLRAREVDRRYRSNPVLNVLLVVSTIAITAFAGASLLQTVGVL